LRSLLFSLFLPFHPFPHLSSSSFPSSLSLSHSLPLPYKKKQIPFIHFTKRAPVRHLPDQPTPHSYPFQPTPHNTFIIPPHKQHPPIYNHTMDNFIENVSGYSMWDIRNAIDKVYVSFPLTL
jgi:hypothetical protein